MAVLDTSPTLPANPLTRHLPRGLVLLAAFAGVPLTGSDYLINAILLPFLALSLAGLGLNLLTGYGGQLSLGSAAFMAMGAFAAYNFDLRIEGLPLPVTMILVAITAAVLGLVFGIPPLRLRGFYLAVSTLAAQFFVQWALTKFGWFSNDSPSGVISAPALEIGGIGLDTTLGRYYLALVTVTLVTAPVWRLVSGPEGANLIAVRDNETAAKVIGVPHRAGEIRPAPADRRRGTLGLRAPAAELGPGEGTGRRKDWIAPDWALLRPIIEASSTAYAAEHDIEIRTGEDEPTTASN